MPSPTSSRARQSVNFSEKVHLFPILRLISSKECVASKPNLLDYIEQAVPNFEHGHTTLTVFSKGYMQFTVAVYLEGMSRRSKTEIMTEHLPVLILRLSRVAFDLFMSKHTTNACIVEFDRSFDSLETLGILIPGSKNGMEDVLVFNDCIIRDYLAANRQAQIITERLASGKRNLFNNDLKKSIRLFPITSDIWIMTFGLLARDSSYNKNALPALPKLFRDIMSKFRAKLGPSSLITVFGLQVLYETRLSDLTPLLNEFTKNDSITFGDLHVQPDRRPFILATIGHLVSTSADLYGLYLNNSSITDEEIGLITDPTMGVSDNNLQVLDLNHNPLGFSGIRRLQRFLVKANLMTVLRLADCMLGNEGVSLLSEVLLCMPLHQLDIAANYLTDEGLRHMITKLKKCPTLVSFNVSHNNLSQKVFTKLADLMNNGLMPNLSHIIARRTHLTPRCAVILLKAMTKWLVTDDVPVVDYEDDGTVYYSGTPAIQYAPLRVSTSRPSTSQNEPSYIVRDLFFHQTETGKTRKNTLSYTSDRLLQSSSDTLAGQKSRCSSAAVDQTSRSFFDEARLKRQGGVKTNAGMSKSNPNLHFTSPLQAMLRPVAESTPVPGVSSSLQTGRKPVPQLVRKIGGGPESRLQLIQDRLRTRSTLPRRSSEKQASDYIGDTENTGEVANLDGSTVILPDSYYSEDPSELDQTLKDVPL